MSLVETLMQPLRSKYTAKTMDKNEMRFSRYGAWDFFQNQTALGTGILTPEVKQLIKGSMGNTVKVPVLDAEDVVISNTRSCTVADSENTSKLVTLTFVTYSFGFTMTPSQHYNNDVAYEQDFQRKLEKYLLKFAATLDTAAVNKLNTDKNQYFPADLLAYYSQSGNALQVADADKNDFYNNLEAIMNTMDYYDRINIIGSTSSKPLVNRLDAQGAGNGINEAFQLGGYAWNYTNRIVNNEGVSATVYAVPDGYVAVENRNDPDARAGSRVGTSKEWSEVQVPIVNMLMGSYYYEDCANKSALNAGTAHLTRTKLEGFEWSTDVCYVTAYNSDPAARYSPILKAEMLAPVVMP